MYQYAFTIKKLSEPLTYVKFFDYVSSQKLVISQLVAELDSNKKLHYHGVIELPQGYYVKKLCIKGYHLKFKEIYSLEGWTDYIHKTCIRPLELQTIVEDGSLKNIIHV